VLQLLLPELESVHDRHGHVHDDDARPQAAKQQRQCFAAVGGSLHRVAVAFEDDPHALADVGMIIHEQNRVSLAHRAFYSVRDAHFGSVI
jgi:hypothetical protein